MKYLFYFTLLISCGDVYSQGGFLSTFQYKDSIITIMQNIVYNEHNNHLVSVGISRSEANSFQSLYIRELDTIGQLVKDTIILDDQGSLFGLDVALPLLVTSDGGYILVVSAVLRGSTIIIKIDNNLEVEFRKEYYPDTTETNGVNIQNMVEVEDGFLLHLSKQHLNFRTKPHILKLDKLGELLWEKEFGDDNYRYSSSSNYMNDNLIIAGSRSTEEFKDGDPSINYLFELDINGDTILTHLFPPNDSFTSVGFNPTIGHPLGGYISNTSVTDWEFNLPNNTQLEITRYSGEFDKLWSKEIEWGPTPWDATDFHTITTDQEGYILASGNYVTEDLNYIPSLLVKLSPDGDILWSRRDTINFVEPDSINVASLNTTERHIVLPSGSIVMCGTSKTFGEAFGNSRYGYIIKVDKDGCMTPDCRGVLSKTKEIKFSKLNKITLVPNPASDKVSVSWKDMSINKLDFRVYTSSGLISSKGKVSNGEFIFINELETGLYVIEFLNKGESLGVEKLVVRY